MTSTTWLMITFGIVVVQRLIELWIAARNQKWILARGGQEFSPEHYIWIVLLHISWLVAWPIESYRLGPQIHEGWPFIVGGLAVAQFFRYGALLSLGHYWNTRIIIVPGEKLVTRGLYRWMPHPNYVAVALELALFPMLFRAWYTATVISVLNAVILLTIRIPAENKALTQLRVRPKRK